MSREQKQVDSNPILLGYKLAILLFVATLTFDTGGAVSIPRLFGFSIPLFAGGLVTVMGLLLWRPSP